MKKVFVDAHVFDGEYQGSRTYIEEIYDVVLANNEDINILFAARDSKNLRRLLKYKNASFVQYRSQKSLVRLFFEIPYLIYKMGCNVAHLQYFLPLLRLPSCKYIVTIHDILFLDFPDEFPWTYRAPRQLLFYHAAKNADILMTVSRYSQQRLSSNYNIRAEDVMVTPNGVSNAYLNFARTADDCRNYIKDKYHIGRFILYVSRIEPRKNQLQLLDAYLSLELSKKGIELVFIGKCTIGGLFLDKYRSLSQETRKYIHWFDQVGNDDLLALYKAAELFVYPSKAEGFGIPPLEAAAVGTSVICSNATAMGDFEFFGDDFFDPNNPDALKKFLGNRLQENSFNIKKTAHIREIIQSRYSWSHSASIVTEALKS